MTKKDFEKFAAMFAGEFASAPSAEAAQIVRNIVRSSADIFAQANPRFDRSRFYSASGIGSDGFKHWTNPLG